MKRAIVRLGYEVGAGEPVDIPLAHLAVTGMTQESGKTTTLEALISRAFVLTDIRAVTFVTKRGEGSFKGGHRMQPFFRERADWVFVSSLIDATMGEKNKMLRAWLMKACRGAETLAEVHRNVRAAKATARGFSESIYTEIDGYLDLVVPQLAQLPPVHDVKIRPGLNVMDLTPYSTELQALVIKSVLEHVAARERDVITVIPEAWEFLPEGRGSPVKREAETLIRKGAVLGNYVWLDSQDLAGVWKLAVRAAAVYLIGVQREANEIKRTLANIPGGVSKPKAADIATLERGQFFACWGRHVVKTYVQPAWMTNALAQSIATGHATLDATPGATVVAAGLDLDDLANETRTLIDQRLLRESMPGDDDLDDAEDTSEEGLRALADEIDKQEDDDMTPEQEEKLDRLIDAVTNLPTALLGTLSARPVDADGKRRGPVAETVPLATPADEEAQFQRFKARLIKEAPALIRVLTQKHELQVSQRTTVVEIDGSTAEGRVALLVANGFFDGKRRASEVETEINKRGGNLESITVYKAIEAMVERGFLWREKLSNRSVVYSVVEEAKAGIIKRKTA